MKIKILCFKVLLWREKNHHYTIKICRLQIWKKRSNVDGNLKIHFIWQNKGINFLQICKGQRVIMLHVLVVLYRFKGTCLIIFFYLQYLGSFKFDGWIFFLLEPLYLCCELDNYCIESVYLEIRLVFTKDWQFFEISCSV